MMATKVEAPELFSLIALQDSRPLFSPLGQSKKIKYTSIAVSPHHVALGANTGGVYCFHRDGLRYIRILSNKEGTISLVRFSPDERCLAVVSGGGHVGFWELNLLEQGISKRFHVSSLLKEASVRAMVWDNKSSRLFYGDDQGRVAVAYTTKLSKKFSSTGSLFKKPDEILYHDKYPIVQMDFFQDVLLVSTHTRCLLMNVQNEKILQVGKRARDGAFGACFHGRWRGRPPVLYSARPGGRLWEADIEGTVVSTLKLKDLVSVPATPILGAGFQPDFEAAASVCLTQPLNFSSLSVLTNRYMVGHLLDSLFVFDPASYRIAAWTCDARGIVDVCCSGKQLFVLCGEGRGVAVMGVLPVRECLQVLVRFGHLKQAELLLRAHSADILQLLPGNRSLYEATETTVEFAKSCDQDLPESLQRIESTLRELCERFKSEPLSGRVEADMATDSDQSSASRRNDPTVDSYAYQSDGSKEGEEEEEEEEEGGGIGGLQSELGKTSLQTEETLTEPNASNKQETGLLVDGGIPLDVSSLAAENSFTQIGSTTDKAVSEEGNSNDVANLDMHVELEEADGIDETDTGLRDNDTTLIPDDRNSSKDSSELTTSLTSDVQSPESSQSHVRSLSWDERAKKPSAQDGDRQPMVQDLTGSELERSFESSSDVQKLSPYPESVGIEIPRRSISHHVDDARAQSEVPDLQNMSDPSTLKVSHSGPSSLEIHPARTELHPARPSTWRNGADSSPKFRRSISFPMKSTLPPRLTSAIKHSTEDDVIAVPVRSASSASLRESGGRSKGRKRKQKKSSNPALSARRRSIPEEDLLASMKPSDNAHPATNILNIPEEPVLPFPEAGLPPSPPAYPSLPLSHSPSQHSHHSSATTSRSISPHSAITSSSPPKPDSLLSNLNRVSFLSKVKSLTTQIADRMDPPELLTATQRTERSGSLKSERLERYPSFGQRSERSSETLPGQDGEQGEQPARGIQKPTALRSKMKSLKSFAKQGGQSVRIEPEAIQRPVKVVKDFFSSLANPQPSPPSQGIRFYDPPYVYRNEGYGYPAESAVSSDLNVTPDVLAVEEEEQEHLDEIPVPVQDPRVSAFCAATAGAMHSLVGPQVLSSPDKLRCTLRDWLQEVENLISLLSSLTMRREGGEPGNQEDVTNESDHSSLPVVDGGKSTESQSEIGSENHQTFDEQPQKSNFEAKNLEGTQLPSEAVRTPADFFQSNLYLGLEDEVRETVIDLVSLCAELGVYGTTAGSGSLRMFVRRYGSVLDVGRMRSLLGTEEWETRSVCWREIARKCTDVLPEDDKVLQLMSLDIDSAVNHIAANASTLGDYLPGYLIRIHEAHPMSLVDLSIRCFPYILPWEIATVCGIDQLDEGIMSHDYHMDQLLEPMATSTTQCNSPGRVLFGNYLSQSLRDEQIKPSMLEILRGDCNLTMLSLEVLLQLGPSKSCLETPDGNPVPWSHMTRWDPSLETLVEVCVAMETQHREAAKLLCAKHGYWIGVVWLSVAMGDGRRALHTVLCLRDMRLFTAEQKWGQLLNSLEDWQLLLELMAELRLPAHTSKSTHTTPQPPDSTPTSKMVEKSSVNTSSDSTGRYAELERAPKVAELNVPEGKQRLQLERTDVQNSQRSQNDIRHSELQHAKYGHDMDGRVEVSWTSVVRLMLGTLSPGAVTRLLSRVDFSHVPGGTGVHEQLHGLLVQLGAVHTQQRAIAHSLLEKVDRYLWSPRPNSLPPQLLNIHTREKQRDQAEERLQAPVFPSLVEFSSTLEDASSHWGVRSNQGAVCGRCQLSLLRSVSDLQPGIIAFCCGHSFHKHCLPEQACITCFTENLKKYHTHSQTTK